MARLLMNQQSNIEELYVDCNTINNESTIVLTDSLVEITSQKLKWLALGENNHMSSAGWSVMLNLVCDNSTINDTPSTMWVCGSFLFIERGN